MPSGRRHQPYLSKAVLLTWLATGFWDFLCASALGVFAYHATFSRFWQGVASTAFGSGVFEMGARGVSLGLMLHFMVALAWSTLFVIAVDRSVVLRRMIARPSGALALAAVYGPIIWLVMSVVVIPAATGKPPVFGFRWWVQIFAHVPFVTLPLVFTARRVLGSAASVD
jgi:hypothetical protein